MIERLIIESVVFDKFHQKWNYLFPYSGWISWNLFLAAIPLVFSFYLFRRSRNRRSLLWWLGLSVYIAFLPNAPYVLTDIVHLIQATWVTPSFWIVTLFYFPLHIGAIILGFEAYVISLINQSAYLRRTGLERYIFGLELITHTLCAIGIYLGRFLRFNSWDIITDPKNIVMVTLNELTEKRPLIVMLGTALILMVLYWIFKQITIGLLLRFKELRHHQHTFD